jgi:hypothetical protein
VNYYLSCLPEGVNPLSEHLLSANNTLTAARVSIIALEHHAYEQHLSILPTIIQLRVAIHPPSRSVVVILTVPLAAYGMIINSRI